MLKVGLIDVDGHNFPNLPLMKLSAWHKNRGDSVEWYDSSLSGHVDRVYKSKVFSFTQDYENQIDADEIIEGGSGYAIVTENGREHFLQERNILLPDEIEHIYPDYSIYPNYTQDTAYGFLSRGCPRGCAFCHVAAKEGKSTKKVADLSEFWHGQKNIVLLDPNLTACSECESILEQLRDSKAWVDFTQGIDIRMMTEKKSELLKQIKVKSLHFAWDRYEDKDIVIPKFKMFKEITGIGYRKLVVFVLCNFNTTHEQDLERIYTLRDLGYNPYVMIYNKNETVPSDKVRQLQRWVNNRFVFRTVDKFEDYNPKSRQGETNVKQ